MYLRNGCYYRDPDGVAVRATLGVDDFFRAFDAHENEIHKIPLHSKYKQMVEGKEKTVSGLTHVEGWTPIGQAVFIASADAPPTDDAPVGEVEEEQWPKKKHRKKKASKKTKG